MALRMCRFKNTHQFIIIWLSLAAFLHNILMNGANNVILSSLQKEFYLSSRETGIYVSVYDIGSLLSGIIVSFAAATGSKPRWIAFGVISLFFGCCIVTLPHFIKPSDDHTMPSMTNTNETVDAASLGASSIELCNYSLAISDTQNQKKYARSVLNNGLQNMSSDDQVQIKEIKSSYKKSSFLQMKHILYLGNMVNGFSSASLTTITFSYIEEIAPHSRSAIYESIYYAVGAFGVGVGFMITSKFLTIHTDIDQMKPLPSWMKPSHPNWIGAWWLPFVLFGFISLILAVVLFTFPRRSINNKSNGTKSSLKKEKGVSLKSPEVNAELIKLNGTANGNTVENKEGNEHAHEHNLIVQTLEQTGSILSLNNMPIENTSFRDLLQKSFELLKKPVFLFVLFASAIEGLLQTSFLAFAALFLEYQYRLASGSASFILGLLSIPPLMIGGILSGIIVKKLNNETVKCFKFLTIVIFFNILVYAGFMIYCKEPNMIPYTGNVDLNTNKQYSVATNCNCDPKIFKPICLKNSNDVFFKSACLAGCTEFNLKDDIFYNCSQVNTSYKQTQAISNENQQGQFDFFTSGLCQTESCTMRLIISYSCIFLLMFMNALTFLPYLKVTIGCIEAKEMNSIGLGLKQFFMNALGTIPGPILFGSVIDSTCTYWHMDQNNQRVCKIYDNKGFAFSFGMLGVGFKTACLLIVILSLILTLRNNKKN